MWLGEAKANGFRGFSVEPLGRFLVVRFYQNLFENVFRKLSSTVKAMKTHMKILIIYAAVSSFAVAMIFPYLWPYMENVVGLSAVLSGVLLFTFYGTEAITRIPIGFLSSIFRHSFIVVGAAFSFVLASLFYLFHSWSWLLFFGGQLFLGLGVSITWVTIPELVTREDGSLPIYTFSVGLGYLGGVTVGGLLVDYLEISRLFTIFMGISIFLVILSLLLQKEITGDSLPRLSKQVKKPVQMEGDSSEMSLGFSRLFVSSFGSFRNAFEIMRGRMKILISGVVSFVMFMTFSLGSSLVPVYLSGVGFSSFLIGVLLSIRMGTGTLIRLAASRMLKIGDKVELLTIGAMVTALSVILFAMTESFLILGLLSLTWGLGGGLYLPLVFDLIADATSEKERGVAMGLRGAMGTSGSAIGTLIFFYIGGIWGSGTSLALFGFVLLVVIVALLAIWEVRKGR